MKRSWHSITSPFNHVVLRIYSVCSSSMTHASTVYVLAL